MGVNKFMPILWTLSGPVGLAADHISSITGPWPHAHQNQASQFLAKSS
jgi:hypothetical protein